MNSHSHMLFYRLIHRHPNYWEIFWYMPDNHVPSIFMSVMFNPLALLTSKILHHAVECGGIVGPLEENAPYLYDIRSVHPLMTFISIHPRHSLEVYTPRSS